MDFLKEIKKTTTDLLPPKAEVSNIDLEGPEIAIYTKNPKAFFEDENYVSKIAFELKKRVNIRTDKSLLIDEEEARKKIMEIVPKEADIKEIMFNVAFSEVVIESIKPGLVIGKGGETSKKIILETGWTPKIIRAPTTPSEILKGIRYHLHKYNAERKKFLQETAKKIYGREPDLNSWIRLTALGSFREVGRSCIMVESRDTKVMLDCGINVASRDNPYPYLDAIRFPIQELDAIVLSHAHLDHCLPPNTPVLLANGKNIPIEEIHKGDKLLSIDWKKGKTVEATCTGKTFTKNHEKLLKITSPYSSIEASPNHRFFTVRDLEIKEVQAQELKEGELIPSTIGIEGKNEKYSDLANLKEVEFKERLPLTIEAKKELKKLRKKNKLSQYKLSKILGKSRNFVYGIENKNQHIYSESLEDVLKFFKTNKDNFYIKYGVRKTKIPQALNEDIAQCAGYIAGDGHISSNYSIRVTDSSTECLNTYKNLISNEFRYTPILRHHSDKEKNAFILEINNKGIWNFFDKNFKEIFYKSKNTTVPLSILTAPKKIVCSFIRGIADAEGSVTQNEVRICSSTSKTFLNQIQFLCSTIGIPTTTHTKDKVVKISSTKSIQLFREKIGFSHPLKREKLDRLILKNIKRSEFQRFEIPINSNDLKKILKEAGIIGGVPQSPQKKELPMSIVDWYNRKSKYSYAKQKTAEKLAEVLKSRVTELEKLKANASIRKKRVRISMTLSQLSETTGISVPKIQKREKEMLKDKHYKTLQKSLNQQILLLKNNTLENIKKINKLLELPVQWQRITKIEEKKNPNPYLVDIEVEPTKNFIAKNIVVHNCGFIPYIYKLGYRGPCYMTEPTRDLSALLQFDYIDVLLKEGREPPYTERDVKEAAKHAITRDYREVTDITPDMRLTFHNAAHILGSASVHLHMGEGGHNLVYSLDSTTPITVFDKNDNIQIIEIGKLVDSEMKKYGIGSSFVEEADNLEGWKTIAFNPQTLKSKIVKISSFIRHPINEDLFEITTKTARKTTVTGSHSIFTVKNGQVVSVKAEELKLGDYIVGSKKLELKHKKMVINLPKSKFALKFSGKKLERLLKTAEKKAKRYFPEKKEQVVNWVKDHLENGLYENAIAKKYKASPKTVRKYFKKVGIEKNLHVKNVFSEEFEVTPELARFIGYFIAEGSFNKNTVIITQYNKDILKDCLQIIKTSFGIEGKIYRNNDVRFNSKQLVLLLKLVLKCGSGAYVKRIPKELALAPKNVISEFLKGYFIGDGSFRIRSGGKGISINCSSKSKFLIQEIAFLLLRLGITPTFEYNEYTKMHNLHVYGRDQLKTFLRNIKISKWEKKLLSQPAHKLKSHFAKRIPIKALSEQTQEMLNKTAWQNAKSCGTVMLTKIGQNASEKKLVKSDLMLDELVSIRKVRPKSKFVYDLSVKGYENFLGGWGHLFMHNSADIKYGFTRLFDAVDIRYPRLETLIIESTYGARDDVQPPRQEAEETLVKVINETLSQGGNVLIPVFAVGRSQEIMLVLENAYRNGMLKDAKIYIDGMTKEASAIHTAYPEYLRRGVQRRVLQNDSPFTSEIFQTTNSNDRDTIIENGGSIIIASSGMLTGGPSVYYLHRLAEDPRNTLIFVGYQGEGSLGRKIQAGVRSTPITMENGKTKELQIKMRVETVEGFSVPFETEIFVKENGEYKLEQIGEIADSVINKSKEGIKELNGIEVAAFNQDGKIEMMPASHIIKHKTKEKHIKITTKSGKEIQVSKGHSLFTFRNGKIESIKGKKLKPKENIVIAAKLPQPNSIYGIDFKEYADPLEYTLNETKFEPKKGGNKRSFINSQCNDMDSLAKFLGYYAAEGHKEKGRGHRAVLSFGRHETETIEDACKSIEKSFGIKPTLFQSHETETQIRVSNKVLVRFLEKIKVGENALSKRVPEIVFNLPFRAQKEFLKAYFIGDGYDYKNGWNGYLAAKSASKKLLSDLSYLLLQHGIIARLKGPFKEKARFLNGHYLKESTAYKLYIAEKDFEKIERKVGYSPFALPIKEICLEKIVKLIKDKKLKKLAYDYISNFTKKGRRYIGLQVVKKIIENLDENKANGEQKKLVRTLKSITEGDIAVDEIVKIEEVEKPEFEYDISVPGAQNFCGGIGGVMLHNSGHADRSQLIGYMHNLRPKPKKTLVNHGDKVKTVEFSKYLSQRFKVNANAIKNLESVRLK